MIVVAISVYWNHVLRMYFKRAKFVENKHVENINICVCIFSKLKMIHGNTLVPLIESHLGDNFVLALEFRFRECFLLNNDEWRSDTWLACGFGLGPTAQNRHTMRTSSFVLVAAHISSRHAQHNLEVAIETYLVIHLFFFLFFYPPPGGAEIQRQPINLNEQGETNRRTMREKLQRENNKLSFVCLLFLVLYIVNCIVPR